MGIAFLSDQSLQVKKLQIYIILFISVLLFGAEVLNAQNKESNRTYSFEFRGESLSEALDRITRTADIDLVYDPQLVRGLNVYQHIRNKHVSEMLTLLLNEFQLDYLTLSSGTIVIVKSVSEGPFFGTFSGKITDRISGDPLPGATVYLADASGGTSTNHIGNFSLNRLMTGSHTIIFSYVGYEPVILTVQIEPNQQLREQIRLAPKPISSTPIVIESHRPGLSQKASQILSSGQQGTLQPAATFRDPIRNLNFVPGVQYGLPMTSLHLQGGQQTEHRILLDDIPIYNPFSVGQLFSSFSPYAIGTIELHRAGYGVEHGSQIAGIVNLKQDHNQNSENSATLQGDHLSMNLKGDVTIPVGNGKQLELMSALRTNFWDQYRSPYLRNTLQNWNIMDPMISNALNSIDENPAFYDPYSHESDVSFFDYHLSMNYRPDDFSSFTGTLYLGENQIKTLMMNSLRVGYSGMPFIFSGDSHHWNNFAGGLRWDKMISPRLDLTLRAGYSSNQFTHSSSIGATARPELFLGNDIRYSVQAAEGSDFLDITPLPTQIDGNSIRHGLISAKATYSVNPATSFEGGFQAEQISSMVLISDDIDHSGDINVNQTSSLISNYLMSRHYFGSNWIGELGSRFTYSTQTDQVYAEPRASIQYDQTESRFRYWSLRFSGGLYRQFINEYRLTNTGVTAIVPTFSIWSHADGSAIPKAWHLSGSWLVEPAENTSIILDGYYKWQPIAQITSYSNLREAQQTGTAIERNQINAFGETTDIRAAGGGIRVEQSLAGSTINLKAGYDYSYSRVNMETQFGRALPAPWNEPHRLQLRAIWHLHSTVSLVSKWQGIWGRSWAYRDAYYNFLSFNQTNSNTEFDFNSPEKDLLPAFYQLDMSVVYRPVLGPADLEFRLDLINLLNRKNAVDQTLNPVFNGLEMIGYEETYRTFPGFYPSVSISAAF
tara:strand:- start:11932 stop:14763 length:2832 start_codon:yes stop_codon:yes gene_type:complete